MVLIKSQMNSLQKSSSFFKLVQDNVDTKALLTKGLEFESLEIKHIHILVCLRNF